MHLIIFLLIVVLCVLKFYVDKKYSYWKNCDVPFPKPTFIFGNVGKAFFLRKAVSDIFLELYRNYEGYVYVGFYNFLSPAIVIRDPDLINNILIKDFDSFQDTSIRVMDPLINNNPFFSGGTLWKKLRKQIAPQLSSVKLKYAYNRIENVCKQMIDYTEKTNNCIDLENYSYQFTGDNVMSCGYSLENKSFLGNPSVLLNVYEQFYSKPEVANLNHTIGFFLPKISKLFNISYMGRQTPKLLVNVIENAVNTRIENGTCQNDFLDFLVELKNKKDFTYLGHGVSFYIDGFKTSGVAMTYMLFELAMNLDVQETAAREILKVYKKHGTVCTSDAVKELVFLENVIYETLRRHTVIKFLNRECTKDITLPHPKDSNKNVFFKKGTQVFIPSEAIHVDSRFYKEPQTFDPSRFDDKSVKKVFFGFGDGHRICPGQKFAVMQLKMGVASILLHFVISVNEKTQFPIRQRTMHLTKVPLNKIWVDFKPRL